MTAARGIVSVGVVLTLIACNTSAQRSEAPPVGLIAAPNATNLKTPKIYDGAITYEVPEAYPGLNLLAFLREQLAKRGWKPVEDDLFNPGQKSSHVRGWSQVAIDDDVVYEWSGQWRSAEGSVVSYSLENRLPAVTGVRPVRPISVEAIHLRKETAEALKAGLKKALKR